MHLASCLQQSQLLPSTAAARAAFIHAGIRAERTPLRTVLVASE